MKFTLAATLILLTLCGHAQTTKKDSIALANIKGERITKVVSKYDRKNLISVGLQTQTDSTASIYFQNFDYDGFPLTDTTKIVRVAIPQFKSFDFDLAVDTLGNSIIVWSQYDIVSMKYKIMSCVLDRDGHVKKVPSVVGTSSKHFVKTSMNIHGQFLISWCEFMNYDLYLKIQLFDKNYNLDGTLLSVYYAGNIETHSYPVELMESTDLAISWLIDNGNRFGPHIKLLNKQGSIINFLDDDYAYQDYFKQSFNMSFSYQQTYVSFSIFTDSDLKKGTYIAIPSRFNPEQNRNIIAVDTEASQLTQIVQDKKGSAFLGWLTDSGEIKAQFFQNSGQVIGDPVELWKDTNGLMAETMDVILTDTNEATIVYAVNSDNQGYILLERLQYHPIQETREIVGSQPEERKVSIDMLSSSKNHVTIWQYNEANQSAVFTQVYDKNFNKIGDPINVTGYKSHDPVTYPFPTYFDVDAAIDSLGNFMIVWSEYKALNNNYIYAKKFDANGALILDKFEVNEIIDTEYKSPKIAANGKGDFIIVWNNDCKLKARLFRKDFDSGEKEIRDCYLSNEQLNSGIVSMNNSGKFIIGCKRGYYHFTLFMYDENMEQVSTAYDEYVLDNNGDIDLQLSDQDQIIMTSSKYNNLDNLITVYRYDWSGAKLGENIPVTKAADVLRKPALSINLNGDFCILYYGYSPTYYTFSSTLYLQKFKQNGLKDGSAFRVNTFTPTPQGVDVTYYGDQITAAWISSAYIPYSSTGNDGNEVRSKNDVIIKGFSNQMSTETETYYHSATILEGDSLKFGLHYLKNAGHYSHTFKTSASKDSTVVLTLKVVVKDPDTVTNVEEKENIIFSIFPNPTHDKVYIEGEEKVLSLEITDALGRRYTSRFNGSEMSLEGLPQGLYYIRINTPKGEVYYKIIKK